MKQDGGLLGHTILNVSAVRAVVQVTYISSESPMRLDSVQLETIDCFLASFGTGCTVSCWPALPQIHILPSGCRGEKRSFSADLDRFRAEQPEEPKIDRSRVSYRWNILKDTSKIHHEKRLTASEYKRVFPLPAMVSLTQ